MQAAQASNNVPARYDPARLRRPTTPLTGRGRPMGLGVHLSVTAAEPAPEMTAVVAAAPAKDPCGPADRSASLPNAGWLTVHARPHQREVSSLSGGVMFQPLSGPLPAGLRFLSPPVPAAPSAHLATCFPRGEDYGLTTLRHRNPAWVRSRLYAGGSTTAPGQFGAPGPGHLPFWSKPVSTFGLSYVTTLAAVHLG
jgi:hypothetical protein